MWTQAQIFEFRIRWMGPPFVINYDLHRAYCLAARVFVLALTGLVFYDVGSRVVHALTTRKRRRHS